MRDAPHPAPKKNRINRDKSTLSQKRCSRKRSRSRKPTASAVGTPRHEPPRLPHHHARCKHTPLYNNEIPVYKSCYSCTPVNHGSERRRTPRAFDSCIGRYLDLLEMETRKKFVSRTILKTISFGDYGELFRDFLVSAPYLHLSSCFFPRLHLPIW
jgi:hypothetical protein